MEHDEQKIEEIMTQLSPSAGMSHRIFGAEVARQYAENIRKQTIEECRNIMVNHWDKSVEESLTFEVLDILQIKSKMERLSALNDLE